MAQLPSWPVEVSDLLMDGQVIAARVVAADGVRTADEQALLDTLRLTQERLEDVDKQVSEAVAKGRDLMMQMLSAVRTGQQPRRLHRWQADGDTPQAA